MTEVVSSLMVFVLRGLRLRRLRLCVGVCVRVKLLENELRLSVAVTLECELRNLLMSLPPFLRSISLASLFVKKNNIQFN